MRFFKGFHARLRSSFFMMKEGEIVFEQMDRYERHYQTNGLRIHAVVWENAHSNATPLVILHGLWESWHTFATLAPRFAQQRTVYALDLRGHGASDKPAAGYRLQDYAADVLGILQQLPYHQVNLLGHSLGGLVALYLAGQAPARLARLVLEDPTFVLEQQLAQVVSQLEQLLALKRQSFEIVAAALQPQFPSFDRQWIEQVAHDLIDTADGTFLAMISGELVAEEQGRVEWSTLLSRVIVPTLVLAADPSVGGWMGEEQHRLVRQALPLAQIVDFAGCGHHIEAASPDAFVETVEGFLISR
jgi:pimeloyl-ACP methyl ester carboxylesterase